jgi:uncharacterized membrane protein SpoIIM required for sporulation/ABC-type transport system involved in multi-copper enzyme maturation permease subunit
MTTTWKTKSKNSEDADEVVLPGQESRGFSETLRNALIITRREVRDSLRDWRIIVPIVILTFFFPFLAQSVAAGFSNFLRGYGAELVAERSIPFLLMIVGFFPISISLVIALETFVGEKERRSLEPLLSTPLTNTELYIGKTLSAMIPPLMASFGGMMVYLLSLLGGQLAWRPQAMLVVQIFLLTIVQALVMVTGAVVVSSQATSTRAANLLASFIIIPMTLLINAESIMMFLAPDAISPYGIGSMWAVLVGMCVVVVLFLRIGNSIFNREELLGRNLDSMNITGTIRKIGRYIRAVDDEGTPASNLREWYTKAIPYSLRKQKTAVLITLAVSLLAFVGGFTAGLVPEWRIVLPQGMLSPKTMELINQFLTPSVQQQAVSFIVGNNVRVLLAATILGFFSFGVMALVLTPTVYVVLGYIFSQLVLSGSDLTVYFAALVPHGVIELPTVLLGTAVAFRLGAIATRPPRGETVGHAVVVAFGDTIKLGLGVILPCLIVAAFVEVYITFQVVQLVVR